MAAVLLTAGVGWSAAAFTGCLVALGSTGIVLRRLPDRGAADTPSGQIPVGIPVFQDPVVVPMVTFLASLYGDRSSAGIPEEADVRRALEGCGIPVEEVDRQIDRLREVGDHLTP